MSTSLSFLFDDKGKLRDEFRKHPFPIKSWDPADDLESQILAAWLKGYQDIPDWEKVEKALNSPYTQS